MSRKAEKKEGAYGREGKCHVMITPKRNPEMDESKASIPEPRLFVVYEYG
jgi:hypothetical protein